MAVIASAMMNLVEANKRAGYVDRASLLGELIQDNSLLKVMPWYPATNADHHTTTKAQRLGHGGFKSVNEGTTITNSIANKYNLPLCEYAGMSQVDNELLQNVDNPAAVRTSEDIMNMAGVQYDYSSQLCYNNGLDPTAFKGLITRRSTLGDYCYDGGSAESSCSSLLLMEFGKLAVNMRYNPNRTPGFEDEDKGLSRIEKDSKPLWVWERAYKISGAPEIRRDDALLRMANLDADTSFPIKTLIKMKNILPRRGVGAVAFVNRDVQTAIECLLVDGSVSNLQLQVVQIENFGPVTMMAGIPLMPLDSLVDTETPLS